MFLFLNRVLKGLVVALGVGAAWLLWQQREHGRPLADLFVVWNEAGGRIPAPLPRSRGTVTDVPGENLVHFRDGQGILWNVGLDGLGGVMGDGRDPRRREFARQTRTNLAARLVGQPAEMAWSVTNANRTALGHLYLGTNSQNLALELVADGRLRWLQESTRALPLWEQARLRGADRRAREQRLGLWKLGLAADEP